MVSAIFGPKSSNLNKDMRVKLEAVIRSWNNFTLHPSHYKKYVN